MVKPHHILCCCVREKLNEILFLSNIIAKHFGFLGPFGDSACVI